MLTPEEPVVQDEKNAAGSAAEEIAAENEKISAALDDNTAVTPVENSGIDTADDAGKKENIRRANDKLDSLLGSGTEE